MKTEIDRKKARNKWARAAVYYNRNGVMKEIIDKPIEMSLDAGLKKSILQGKRKKRLNAALTRKRTD